MTVRSGAGEVTFGLRRSGLPRIAANRATYLDGPVRAVYANGPVGLEQTFLLRRGSSVAMSLAGNLHASLRDGSLVLVGAGASLRYTGLIATDARGRRLPAAMHLRGDRLVLDIDTRGARYPVRIDPFVAAGNLNEASPSSDAFGYSSAVSGATIAVGAPARAVGSSSSQGAVFVFTERSTGWASSTTSTMLTASDGAAGDQLGFTVATNGTTIVAGAPEHGASGTVYVFVQHSGTWGPSQTAELAAAGSGGSGGYLPVAISPDGKTIVWGKIDATVGGKAQQGEAFAATEPAGGWGSATAQVADLTAGDGAASDLFGLEVAASDGTIAVVGGNGSSGSEDVAVYVFTRSGAAWNTGNQTAELTNASSPMAAAGSGSLAISPDGRTIVAGDPYTMVGSNAGQGEAFVFAEPGGAWGNATVPSATLTERDGATGDNFGFAAGISNNTIVVSAPTHAVGGTVGIGGIYVFDEPPAGWTGALEQTQELNPDTKTAGLTGYSIGFDGATIVAGTRAHQQGAWLFTPAGTGPSTTTTSGTVPTEIGPPTISGSGEPGSTLTCSQGTWSGSPTGFSFQWYRDGTPIAGATSSTYTVQTSDEGLTITCAVTAANAKGSAAATSSSRIAVAVKTRKGCPAATGGLSGTRLGLVKLGMTRAAARQAYKRSSNRGKRYEEFFCLSPIGVRVGYGSRSLSRRQRNRVIWASTSSAYYAVDGIRVGATIVAAGRALKLTRPFKVGANTWYLGPNGASNAIFKVRHGLIEEIGIADRSLTRNTKADRIFLRSFS